MTTFSRKLLVGALGVTVCGVFSSCDSDGGDGGSSGGGGSNELTFPGQLLSGDKFVLTRDQTAQEIEDEIPAEVDTLDVDSETTFTWGSGNYTIGSYEKNRADGIVRVRNAALDVDVQGEEFRTVYGALLQDFGNPVRTILRERRADREDLTMDDLIIIAAQLNAGLPEDGEMLVVIDEDRMELSLVTEHNFTFEVIETPNTGFPFGVYRGRFEEQRRGFPIVVKTPSEVEKRNFRLDSNDGILRVSGSSRFLPGVRTGDFVWTLSTQVGFREDVVDDTPEVVDDGGDVTLP